MPLVHPDSFAKESVEFDTIVTDIKAFTERVSCIVDRAAQSNALGDAMDLSAGVFQAF